MSAKLNAMLDSVTHLPSCHAVNVMKLIRLPANSTEVCQEAPEALVCARKDDLSLCMPVDQSFLTAPGCCLLSQICDTALFIISNYTRFTLLFESSVIHQYSTGYRILIPLSMLQKPISPLCSDITSLPLSCGTKC